MLRIFIGYDDRQAISYNVLQSSIMRHARKTVSITPLILSQLPMKRQGLTPFTYSRFICPYLCGYEGMSLFLDADMMVRADIGELFNQGVPGCAVNVVQSRMRFEWSSVMLFNNKLCRILTPEFIDDEKNNPLKLAWAAQIGKLPPEWNHLVGYDDANQGAKLVHFTQGIPVWPETATCEFANEWRGELGAMMNAKSWTEIMGNSVHARPVLERFNAGQKEVMA